MEKKFRILKIKNEENLQKNLKETPEILTLNNRLFEVEKLNHQQTDNKEISQIHGAMAGIASGIIKVPEGIFSFRCRTYGCYRYDNRCCS